MQLQKPRTYTSEGRLGHSAQGCASTRSDTEEQGPFLLRLTWGGLGATEP